MRATLVTELDGVAEIEDEWRTLAILRGNAFLTPEWFRAWVAPQGGQTPLAVVVRDSRGAVAGVLPLAADAARRPRAIRFAGSRYGDRFGIASRPEDESAVAATAIGALESGPGGGRVLVLNRIDANAQWPAALAAAAGRRLALVDQGGAELPHVSVADLDWDGYLAQRSRKFRQRIARGLERGMEDQGIPFSVHESGGPAEVERDMALLFRLHDLRHARSGSSIASARVRASLTSFALAAREQGWLRLRVLEISGKPAAAYLAWRLGPSYAVYQSGFDPSFADQSAGMLLLNDTVRSAIGERAHEVDLLLGGEPYKWRFAPESRHVRSVVLVAATSPIRLLIAAEAIARRRSRRLAASSRLGRALRRIASRLPGGG